MLNCLHYFILSFVCVFLDFKQAFTSVLFNFAEMFICILIEFHELFEHVYTCCFESSVLNFILVVLTGPNFVGLVNFGRNTLSWLFRLLVTSVIRLWHLELGYWLCLLV